MDTKPGRGWRSAAGPVLALAAWLLAPAVGRAQLFPDMPTRYRDKPPCVAEPPFYKMVRHQYFGYYPTCWRRFPGGWTCPCPNPELPNFQASLEKKPLEAGEAPGPAADKEREPDPFEGDRPKDRPGPASPDVPLPVPDSGGSLFDKPGDMRPASPPPLEDRPAPERPAPGRNRADGPRTEAAPASALPPAVAVAAGPAAPATRLDLPPVAEAAPEVPPLLQAGSASAPPTPAVAAAQPDQIAPAEPEPAEATASTPIPAAPDPSLPVPTTTSEALAGPTPPPAPISTPAQALQRRGIISGFFNRIRRR